MSDLVPWKKRPKGEISRLHREFDDLFNRFLRRDFGVPGDPLGKGLWFPTTDILEDKKKITLKVEIPGVEARDIDVSLDGRRLTIKGEKNRKKRKRRKIITARKGPTGSFGEPSNFLLKLIHQRLTHPISAVC